MTEIHMLIERWQGGDERAAEALYNRYQSTTFRLAYHLLGNSEDAEEAAQDALAYALTHIACYDPRRASFTTWLNAITVSRCRDRQRRRRLPSFSLSRWLQGGGDTPDPAPSPEFCVVRGETTNRVWREVQALSPQLREAVVLRYWADHSYQEMALILGCPLRTAQSRVRAAYQRLRVKLTSDDLATLREEDVS